MNNELKVSFYLKREGNTERTETNPDTVFPIGQSAKVVLPLNSTERLIKLISPYMRIAGIF